ncbi:MAG: hypothetical protein ACLP8S_28735 [Solirubrobacteraceae bacterium]
MRQRWALAIAVVVVVAGLVVVAVLRSGRSNQREVSADELPVVAGAYGDAVFVDCSPINDIAYFANNPCETFVLVRSHHFGSASAFLGAEARRLLSAGWRHPSIAPPVDYNAGGATASLSNSWFSPQHRACAYVDTVRDGVAAEHTGLFPYDPYNQPAGVLSFYRTAKAAAPDRALWVRLRPPVMAQPGAC